MTNEGWKEKYEALPKAGSHRLIDFEQANVVTDRPPAFPPQFLMVTYDVTIPLYSGLTGTKGILRL
jgi:hypothetical protein